MGSYRLIKSLIQEIAKGIDRLIDTNVLTGRERVAVYGLERYSFAIRTIMEHRNMVISCYVSEDHTQVIQQRRKIKDFVCRYLSNDRDVIDIVDLDEYLERKERDVLLIADPGYHSIAARMDALGLKENKDYYMVYDFSDEDINRIVTGRRLISVDEMKHKEKAMLKFIDRYCNENRFRYWVCGGTLLGTIRHKGFIPWDDDIDIFLPMPDFLKFTLSLKNNPEYELMGYGTDGGEDFIEPYAKLLEKKTVLVENIGTLRKVSSVWVDVFPIIGLPGDERQRHSFFNEYQEIEKSAWQDFYKTDGDIAVFKKWFVTQKEYLQKYDFDTAEYVGVLGTLYGKRDCASKSVYDDTIRMRFEDIEVNVPIGYDEYLSNHYGSNYMDLPPIEKRVALHDIKAYE